MNELKTPTKLISHIFRICNAQRTTSKISYENGHQSVAIRPDNNISDVYQKWLSTTPHS